MAYLGSQVPLAVLSNAAAKQGDTFIYYTGSAGTWVALGYNPDLEGNKPLFPTICVGPKTVCEAAAGGPGSLNPTAAEV